MSTNPMHRPLGLGQLLELSLRIYRKSFWPYFLLFFAGNALVYLIIKIPHLSFLMPLAADPNSEGMVGSLVIFYLALFVGLFLSFILNNFLLGFITLQVEHLYGGQILSGRIAFRRLMALFFPLIFTLFIGGFLTGVGLLFCLVPGLLLLIRLSFTAPVFLMEDFRYFEAIQRSWTLTGHKIGGDWTGAVYWRVSAILILGVILGYIVGLLFQMPFTVVAMIQGFWNLKDSGGAADPFAMQTGAFLVWATMGEVAGLMGRAIIQPYLIIAMVTLYLDTRGRRDGLHLIYRSRSLRRQAAG